MWKLPAPAAFGAYAVSGLARFTQWPYYTARSRPPSAREERQSSLTTKNREVHLASRETLAHRECTRSSRFRGLPAVVTRSAKLMRRSHWAQGDPALSSSDRLA